MMGRSCLMCACNVCDVACQGLLDCATSPRHSHTHQSLWLSASKFTTASKEKGRGEGSHNWPEQMDEQLHHLPNAFFGSFMRRN